MQSLGGAIKCSLLLVAKHLLIGIDATPVVLARSLLTRCPFCMRLDVLFFEVGLFLSGSLSRINQVLGTLAVIALRAKTVLFWLFDSGRPSILAGRNLA